MDTNVAGPAGPMVVKTQPHSETLGLIAREMALDIGASSYAPDEAVHIPGISNTAADCLSRVFEPGPSATLPSYLALHLAQMCSPRPK